MILSWIILQVPAMIILIEEHQPLSWQFQNIETKKRAVNNAQKGYIVEEDFPERPVTRSREVKVLDVVILHWDDMKLLPALSARKSKREERFPIVTSYGLKEQLIAVPKLDNSTGKEQAQAVWRPTDGNSQNKV
ncbi:hypothetical protein AVEN_160248-1 [Araneus ventricosus]|uniref:DUF5641 domain-containing protein n=1 Tax=Araneus ventricosus TaxID=182803 RepID=A0A4Y2UGQ5_ARAVE|nr:hypothetical protein AVEN_160248-1 [Araneus ventricosus]